MNLVLIMIRCGNGDDQDFGSKFRHKVMLTCFKEDKSHIISFWIGTIGKTLPTDFYVQFQKSVFVILGNWK